MIHDVLTDLVPHECRDPDRWRAAFRASIGARRFARITDRAFCRVLSYLAI